MKNKMDYLETLEMINEVKWYFEKQLERNLSLIKVPCPLFVNSDTGLQDCLTGTEKAISFVKDGEKFEVVHSLAKWKRDALKRYNFPIYTGLYTDMKAIRKDEVTDDIHSLFVEQWDWEKVISKDDRNIEYLESTVTVIYKAIIDTLSFVKEKYPFITVKLPEAITFISSQELEDLYPFYSAREREYAITADKKAVFVIGIGNKLKSGYPHDLRSPDYDDWDLNGDILIYDEHYDRVIEITSMGIRVDKESLISQLFKANCMERIELPYHQNIIEERLPYTIGGGIGQSRILMLLLEKSHIAEVQASSLDKKTLKKVKDKMIL